jgi:hypothetical protein
MKKYAIIYFIFSLYFLLASCQKTRTIPENKTDEPEQIVQTIENEIMEDDELEQTVTQLSDGWRPEIPIRERIALPFIEALKSGDRNEIVKFFHYPMRRIFPLPYIKNEQEMLDKFDMVFTDEIISDIANSPDHEWKSQAWRGITFYNGKTHLWMDYDGKVFRIPESDQEEELRNEFWIKDRERLLPEFRQFDGCMGLYASATYNLRVDYFIIGNEWYDRSYRALLWERNGSKTMSDMPDIILTNMNVARSRGQMAGSLYYFIDNDKVYVIETPSFYIDKGELFIGKYTESFEPVLFDEYEAILLEEFIEEIIWSE